MNSLSFNGIQISFREVTFFFYNFGPNNGDSKQLINEEPWRVDEKNLSLLKEKRKEFLKLLNGKKKDFVFVSTRELSIENPNAFVEEDPLSVPAIFQQGGEPQWPTKTVLLQATNHAYITHDVANKYQ